MKGFYHIWAWRPSSISDQNHFSYFSFPQCLDATCEIWLHLAQWFQRRSRLKVWTDDGRTTEASYTISSPGAFGSGELKTTANVLWSNLCLNGLVVLLLFIPFLRCMISTKSQLFNNFVLFIMCKIFYVNFYRLMAIFVVC